MNISQVFEKLEIPSLNPFRNRIADIAQRQLQLNSLLETGGHIDMGFVVNELHKIDELISVQNRKKKNRPVFAIYQVNHENYLMIFTCFLVIKALTSRTPQRCREYISDTLKKVCEEYSTLSKMINDVENAINKINHLMDHFGATDVTDFEPKILKRIVSEIDHNQEFYGEVLQKFESYKRIRI